MESILTSIKKLLGITEEYSAFDVDIIIHINSAFSTLNQLGVGPKDGFKISDDLDSWSDFINDEDAIESIKTYIYLKVKLVFDPPSSSSHMQAIKESIKELEWRLNVECDNKEQEDEDTENNR